jgi:hypothetical protein
MSDPDIQAEGAPTGAPEAPAEPTAAGSQPVEQLTPQAPEGQPAESAKEKPSPAAGEPAKPQVPAPQEPPKPVSRRSASFRIQQLVQENTNTATERDEWKRNLINILGTSARYDRSGGYGALTDPCPAVTNDGSAMPGLRIRCVV